jgi:hypothetical protein
VNHAADAGSANGTAIPLAKSICGTWSDTRDG